MASSIISDVYFMRPIGHIKSVFKFKNGTPRQPTVSRHSRGSVTIEKSVFNNPEHSLEGLVSFSHVWILFVFHKNDNVSTKAKVKPPHLNGRKVGLFSCRSPHRPNPIGLTLAKLDRIEGATIFLSGIDMLDGTPVLDIKPYIPGYDSLEVPVMEGSKGSIDGDTSLLSPQTEQMSPDVPYSTDGNKASEKLAFEWLPDKSEANAQISTNTSLEMMKPNKTGGQEVEFNTTSESIMSEKYKLELNDGDLCTSSSASIDPTTNESFQKDFHTEQLQPDCFGTNNENPACTDSMEILSGLKSDSPNLNESNFMTDMPSKGSNEDSVANIDNNEAGNVKNNMLIDSSSTADWIQNRPLKKLSVRFTPHAQSQLAKFSQTAVQNEYKFQLLNNSVEAQTAIEDILREDPRSVYRRKQCQDSLYYFTIDCVHITCWFDEAFVEVVRIKPMSTVEQCNK